MFDLEKKVLEYFQELDNDGGCSRNEIVYAWNYYCDENRYYDDCLYCMDDFNELFYDTDKFELVRMVVYGEFNPADDYFFFNGYGNLVTVSWPLAKASPIDIDSMAQYVADTEDNLNNDDIQAIIDEYRCGMEESENA